MKIEGENINLDEIIERQKEANNDNLTRYYISNLKQTLGEWCAFTNQEISSWDFRRF